MITLALLLQHSHASSLKLVHPDDNQIISTPFGDITRDFARRACGAEYVLIGTVENVNSYSHPEGGGGSRIMSHLTFSVERIVHGSPPHPFVLTVPGGTVGATTSFGPRSHPRPLVGRRYAVACSTVTQPTQYLDMGSPLLHATVSISGDVVLPSAAELQEELDAFCSSEDLPRGGM